MQDIVTLTFDDAERAATACVALAQSRKLAIAVAVVDSAGQLLRLERMDGARGFTAELAVRKARTSATIGVPTAVLAATLNGRPLHSNELIAVAGGAPVLSGALCAGAVGISGSTPDQDEEVLASGLTAILESLGSTIVPAHGS